MKLFPAMRHSRRGDDAHRLPAIRRLVRGAALVGAAVALGLIGTGTTYAVLNSSANAAPTAKVTAGTAALVIQANPINVANLYPGRTERAPFTITNTGNVDLSLTGTITGTTSANGLVIGVVPGNCVGNTAPAVAAFAPTSVAKGASTGVCLTVSVPANAPASAIGASATIAVTITGSQT